MNIALLDLNHMTLGVHTNTVPLGIGLIARYLSQTLDGTLDIRMFKDPRKFLDTMHNWKPDVLGIAQYVWNSHINLYMAKLAKEENPQCIVVAGGPDLYLTSGEREAYLKKYPQVDLCVSYDGEIAFSEIVKRLVAKEKIANIKDYPCAGTYSMGSNGSGLIESKDISPRLNSLDVFGSTYADGFFDNFLDCGFHPFVQTHRGCPFGCAYCHTSDKYYSRMIFQSQDNFSRDMEYLGKRFAGKHNVVLYIANTNFGLFKEDFPVAKILRQIQDKYDWPKNINVNSGPDPDKVLELLSVLKYKFIPSMSLQTLTPKVLENIGRKNIAFGDFVNFQKQVTKRIGEKTTTELILSLPGETKETFLDTVSKVLDSGVQNIVIYTLMSLKGTPLALPQTIKDYGYKLKHRIVSRCFSQIGDIKIFETEAVAVENNTMSYEDYLDLRGLSLIITVFASSAEFYPLRKLLKQDNLSVADWVFGLNKKIMDFPGFYSMYKSFLQETQDELFSSESEIDDFFGKQENYDLLIDGSLGDNLLRKYKAIALSLYYQECLELALLQLRESVGPRLNQELIAGLIADLELYLKSRDVRGLLANDYKDMPRQSMVMHYDIPRWLDSSDDNLRLADFAGKVSYRLGITEYMRNRLKDYKIMNRDLMLSLQMLYRDGYIKDFWPEWVLADAAITKDAK